jgi:hypothetical protein
MMGAARLIAARKFLAVLSYCLAGVNGSAKSGPGQKADFTVPKCDFRYTPDSRLNSDMAACLKCANERNRSRGKRCAQGGAWD